MFTLLVNVARSKGKLLEPQLVDSWGGWPSTTLLRHRDKTIEAPTKARYHKKLQELVGELVLPSADEELANPVAADVVYRSATNLLKEKRRGPKFKLLLRENALYGFRRNLLGLKRIAHSPWLAAMAAGEILLWVRSTTPPSGFAVAVGINLGSLLTWWLVVTPDFVRGEASYDYASALLRTLDASARSSPRPSAPARSWVSPRPAPSPVGLGEVHVALVRRGARMPGQDTSRSARSPPRPRCRCRGHDEGCGSPWAATPGSAWCTAAQQNAQHCFGQQQSTLATRSDLSWKDR